MNPVQVDDSQMKHPRTCPQCGAALAPEALEGLCPACLLQQGAAADSGSQPGQAPFEALPVPEVARLFPQLEVLELIGKGGMGAIYKAGQPSLGRFVALKILPPGQSGGRDFAERFNREARALARLSHPNIVAVHEFGQVNGSHYFLMEYVDGVNLRQLQKTARISPRQALEIVPQICDALQYAHDEGVVHRDIKPENILIDRRGRVKIADFGLARILGSEPEMLRLTREGHVMGTPHYMAPEQVEHPLEVDHRADIYGLGVVFYEMLTGELPLGKFAPPSRKVQVDVRLDEVVLRALEKEPDLRYQQASQVKTAVEKVTQTPHSGLTPPRIPAQHGKTVRWRGPVTVGLAVWVLCVLGAAMLAVALPKQYLAIARVEVSRPPEAQQNAPFDPYFIQTEFEKVRSVRLSQQVAEELALKREWAGRFGPENMSTAEAAARLLRTLEVRQSRNTSLIEIRYAGHDSREAAEIANKYAELYRAANPDRVRITNLAAPAQNQARPNVPLILVSGGLLGVFLGAVAAGVALLVTARRSKTPVPDARPVHSGRSPRVAVAGIAAAGLALLVLGLLTGRLGGLSGSFSVTGTVTDGETGLPIAGARVANHLYDTRTTRAPRETWTDAEGRFALSAAHEEHALVASAPGYAPISAVPVTQPTGRQQFLNFQLDRVRKFGPVKDLVLTDFKSGAGNEAIDLDTGELVSVPSGIEIARTPAAESPDPPARPQSTNAPLLQFRWAVDHAAADLPVDEFPHPGDRTGQAKIRVLKDVALAVTSVARAGVDLDPIGGLPQIRVRLNEPDAKRFEELTAENINRQLAIVFDGKLLTAPVIRTRIAGGEIIISGIFTRPEMHAIVDALNQAAIPASKRTFFVLNDMVFPPRPTPDAPWALLDLDTARAITNKNLHPEAREWRAWLRESGADLTAAGDAERMIARTFDMVVVAETRIRWDELTPADVLNSWPLMTLEPAGEKLLWWDPAVKAPEVYLFRTREDGWGVLQLVGSSEQPPGMKVRYKLVTPVEFDGQAGTGHLAIAR